MGVGYVGTVALARKNVTMTLLVVITDMKNNPIPERSEGIG